MYIDAARKKYSAGARQGSRQPFPYSVCWEIMRYPFCCQFSYLSRLFPKWATSKSKGTVAWKADIGGDTQASAAKKAQPAPASPAARAPQMPDPLSTPVHTSATGETRPKGLFAHPLDKTSPGEDPNGSAANKRKTPSEQRATAERKYREELMKSKQEALASERERSAAMLAASDKRAQQHYELTQQTLLANQKMQERNVEHQRSMAAAFATIAEAMKIKQAASAQSSVCCKSIICSKPLPPDAAFCPKCGLKQ